MIHRCITILGPAGPCDTRIVSRPRYRIQHSGASLYQRMYRNTRVDVISAADNVWPTIVLVLAEDDPMNRVVTIRYPHDTIRVAILGLRYDTYRDTF